MCASTAIPSGPARGADGLEAEPGDARASAGGYEQAITAQLATAVELEDVLLAVTSCRRGAHPEDELDAVAAQRLPERLAQRRRLA